MTKPLMIAAIVAMAFLFAAGDAAAYVDPGTGSMLLQGIVAAVAASVGVIAVKWQRLKGFLSSRQTRNEDSDSNLLEGKEG